MVRTIEQLEKENWGDPGLAGSSLIQRCLLLRRKPINQFSVEELRLMIGQDIGTKYLFPYALDMLESNPLVDSGLYPGDLLAGVLRLPVEYWSDHPDQLRRAVDVARKGLDGMERNGRDSMFDRKMRWEFRGFIWQHERIACMTPESIHYTHYYNRR